jgi:hypothetical protein
MVERRDVELALRAKDLSSATFAQATKAVRDLTSAISDQAAGVARGETALDDLRQTYKQLEQAGKALLSQQGLIDQFNRQSDSVTRYRDVVAQARQRADEFKASLASKTTVSARAEARMQSLEGRAKRVADAMKVQQTALERTSKALEAAGVDTADLANTSKVLLANSQQIGAGLTSLQTVISGYSKTVAQAREAEKNRERAAEYAALSAEADRLATSYGRLNAANVQLARTQARAGGGAEAAVAGARGRPQASNLGDIENSARVQAAAVDSVLGKPVQNYLGILEELERSLRSVQAVARQVDGYQAQANAVRATREVYMDARARLRELQEQLRRDPTPQNRAALAAQLPVLERTKTAFIEQFNSLKVLREELRQAGVNTRDLSGTQTRLVDTARNATNAIKALNENYAKFGGSAREGPAGLLGLRPYELQNLSFQINDFFTQIASGTSATQAFAQQIGQVAQIEPIWRRIVSFAPLFATLAASIGLTVGVLSRLNQTASSTRNFGANLSLITGGFEALSGVSAEQLTALARSVERLGFAFEDARKASLLFLREGVAPAEIARSTEAAARLSRVIGVDIAEAAGLLSRALTGGVTGLRAFEERGIRFTDSQRRLIEAARESNDQFRLQATILDILAGRLRAADEQGLGPWTRAAIAAKEAWRGFLDELGRSAPFQIIEAGLNGIARGFVSAQQAGASFARVLLGAFNPALAAINLLKEGITQVRRLLGFGGAGPAIIPPGTPGAAGAPTRSPGEIAAENERIRREREFERDTPSSVSRLTTAQRVAAAREVAERQFREQFPQASARDIQVIADLAEIEIRRKIQQELQSGGQSAAADLRRDFQEIQRDIQDTIRARDETIRGVQEDVAAGTVTPVDAIARIQQAADEARPSLQRLADEARRFRDQNAGSDTMRASAFDRLVAQADRAAGAQGSRAGVTAVLGQSEQEIRRILQERQQIIQTNNALEQQGIISRAESERRIVEAYDRTNESLRSNIDAYEAASRAAAENQTITANAAALNTAKIEEWRASLQRINPEWARLKQGIENTIGQAAGTFFNSVGEALGDALAGVTSLSDAFDAAGRAALQFFADVLKGIAQVILQEQILQAVRLVTKVISAGVGHTGGAVGSAGFGSGRKRAVNPAWFAGAPRLHSGTLGLSKDEYPAILQSGEEVLARDDPRNIFNRGKGAGSTDGGGGTVMKNVLAIGEEQIAAAMQSGPGERVMLNFLRTNAPTVRQLIRG